MLHSRLFHLQLCWIEHSAICWSSNPVNMLQTGVLPYHYVSLWINIFHLENKVAKNRAWFWYPLNSFELFRWTCNIRKTCIALEDGNYCTFIAQIWQRPCVDTMRSLVPVASHCRVDRASWLVVTWCTSQGESMSHTLTWYDTSAALNWLLLLEL